VAVDGVPCGARVSRVDVFVHGVSAYIGVVEVLIAVSFLTQYTIGPALYFDRRRADSSGWRSDLSSPLSVTVQVA
jgi:hypothetical protein